MLGISFVLLNNVVGHLGLLHDWTPWIVAVGAQRALPAAVDVGVPLAGAVPMTPPTRHRSCFAHGARDPRWAAPFEAVAARVRARAPERARAARLPRADDARPGATPATSSPAVGCTRIDVVPLFLGIGGHVRRDLPALLDELRARARRHRLDAARRARRDAARHRRAGRRRARPRRPRLRTRPHPLDGIGT